MKPKASGFSLIELLVWVALVAILMASLFTGYGFITKQIKKFSTESILKNIKHGVDLYALNVGKVPSREAGGLSALVHRPQGPQGADWSGPYVGENIKTSGDAADGGISFTDSWGRPIEYNSPPVNYPEKFKEYEIISYGPDEQDPSGYIFKGDSRR